MSLKDITLTYNTTVGGSQDHNVPFSPVASHPTAIWVQTDAASTLLAKQFAASCRRSTPEQATLAKIKLSVPVIRNVDNTDIRDGMIYVDATLKAPSHATKSERDAAAREFIALLAADDAVTSAFIDDRQVNV